MMYAIVFVLDLLAEPSDEVNELKGLVTLVLTDAKHIIHINNCRKTEINIYIKLQYKYRK